MQWGWAGGWGGAAGSSVGEGGHGTWVTEGENFARWTTVMLSCHTAVTDLISSSTRARMARGMCMMYFFADRLKMGMVKNAATATSLGSSTIFLAMITRARLSAMGSATFW